MQNEPIRYQADTEAIKQGCYYDPSIDVEPFQRFTETFCMLGADYDNKPIQLLDFQLTDIIGPLLGWRKANGNLRHDLSLIYGPKSFGKSMLCSCLVAYWLCSKKEQSIRLIAAKADQCKIILQNLETFARHPAIAKRWTIKTSQNNRSITDNFTKSVCRIYSANPSGISGEKVDLLIADEFSEWESYKARTIWDRICFADSKSPKRGVKIVITTPSHETGQHPGYKFWNRAKDIIAGKISDDINTHACVYGADQFDDWESEKTWAKAGPHVGKLPGVNLQYYRDKYLQAKGDPQAEIAFRIYLLGQYVENKQAYVSMSDWGNCRRAIKPEQLKGLPSCIGLDFGGNNDILGWVVVTPIDNAIFVSPRAAITQNAYEKKIKLGQTYYLGWAKNNLIRVVDEPTISMATLESWLEDDYSFFDIKALAYDTYGLSDLQKRWDELGRLIINTPPYPKHIGPLLVDFERRIKEQTMVHDDHEILNWCISNLRIKEQGGRFTTRKLDERNKIDLGQATIISLNALPEITKPTWDESIPPVFAL